ncbi:hypothetical protein [Paracoccus sp. N5]|uniref:hypothetical protein n=1 Tax=Paracoccus sp. N5 TaxID=1101189 RepID=UPI0012FCEF6F|nr:hypothetical protein [Paracoccus sp. N5]
MGSIVLCPSFQRFLPSCAMGGWTSCWGAAVVAFYPETSQVHGKFSAMFDPTFLLGEFAANAYAADEEVHVSATSAILVGGSCLAMKGRPVSSDPCGISPEHVMMTDDNCFVVCHRASVLATGARVVSAILAGCGWHIELGAYVFSGIAGYIGTALALHVRKVPRSC